MLRFRLNSKTKKDIHSATGMDVDFIANTDVDTIDSNIESYADACLKPATKIGGLLSRGSVYLMFQRFFTNNEIEHQLSRIKP